MLAKDMCSQNQKVGHLICLIHNNVFWTQRIFRFLRNSLFRTNDFYSKNKTEQDLCKERTCSVFYRKTIWRRSCLPWNSISFLNDFMVEIMRDDDFGIYWETSFPVPPMSRENSGGNYPRKGQVRRRGVYEWSLGRGVSGESSGKYALNQLRRLQPDLWCWNIFLHQSFSATTTTTHPM